MIYKSVVLGMISKIKNWKDFEEVAMDIIKLAREGKLDNKELNEIKVRLNKKERELTRK